MKLEILDPLVKKLSVCRQIAEHKSEMLRIRGGDKANVFKALTNDERTKLDYFVRINETFHAYANRSF